MLLLLKLLKYYMSNRKVHDWAQEMHLFRVSAGFFRLVFIALFDYQIPLLWEFFFFFFLTRIDITILLLVSACVAVSLGILP